MAPTIVGSVKDLVSDAANGVSTHTAVAPPNSRSLPVSQGQLALYVDGTLAVAVPIAGASLGAMTDDGVPDPVMPPPP